MFKCVGGELGTNVLVCLLEYAAHVVGGQDSSRFVSRQGQRKEICSCLARTQTGQTANRITPRAQV